MLIPTESNAAIPETKMRQGLWRCRRCAAVPFPNERLNSVNRITAIGLEYTLQSELHKSWISSAEDMTEGRAVAHT